MICICTFRSVFLNVPGLLVINILALLAGIVMFAYYTEERCDPLGNKDIRNANQVGSFKICFLYEVMFHF